METFNERKFRELVLYIAGKSEDDPRFGAVKLNKILYFADFFAHRELGRSVSGADYQHLPEGPAPRQMLAVKAALLSDGSVEEECHPYFNRVQKRLVAKRPADLSLFSGKEIAIVDEVIEALAPMNGREASDLSHEEPGWLLTEEGETIPYRTAWLSREPLTIEQIEYGRKLAERHGLLVGRPHLQGD